MVRMSLSGFLGFIRMYIESVITMHIKGTATIEFGGITPFINVWAMNFFFVFAILSQIGNWYENKLALEKGEHNEFH